METGTLNYKEFFHALQATQDATEGNERLPMLHETLFNPQIGESLVIDLT